MGWVVNYSNTYTDIPDIESFNINDIGYDSINDFINKEILNLNNIGNHFSIGEFKGISNNIIFDSLNIYYNKAMVKVFILDINNFQNNINSNYLIKYDYIPKNITYI
jgi:hypothetical protein